MIDLSDKLKIQDYLREMEDNGVKYSIEINEYRRFGELQKLSIKVGRYDEIFD